MRTRLTAAFAGGALIAGVVVVGGLAAAQPDGEEITACVKNNNGQMRLVDSWDDCLSSEYPVTWNQAGAPGPQGPEGPQGPPGPGGEPLDLFVDCDAGESIGAALNDARDHLGAVTVTISGVCDENVLVDRDDINFSGVQPSDGIRSASGADTVFIDSARRVRFDHMTISGGTSGITVERDSAFASVGLTVRDTTIIAINITAGSSADLADCLIVDNNSFGVFSSGGDVEIRTCDLSNNGSDALISNDGGAINAYAVNVSGNAAVGVTAFEGATVTLNESEILGNGSHGVRGLANGTVGLNTSRVADNKGDGAQFGTGSMLNARDATIEGNGAAGISAEQGSVVVAIDSVVRDNASDGMRLEGLSNGSAGEFPGGLVGQIVDNGGFGIRCSAPPAVAAAQYQDILASPDLSGNALGPTNCP